MTTTRTRDKASSGALRQIEAFENQWNYDSAYMKHMLAVHPEAFRLFQAVIPMAGFRRQTPKEAFHVAKLTAFQVVDCGTCLQLAVRVAKSDGIDSELIEAVLFHPERLSGDLAEIRDFVRALGEDGPKMAAMRERLQARLGEPALVEIGLCVAAAGVFPMLKKVLGYFESARQMNIEI